MDNVGDEETFFYVIRHWTDDNGNPVDMDSNEEWETIECAREYAKACPKHETVCIVEARHVVKEVYHG